MAWRLPDYEPMNLIGSGPTGSVVLSRDRTTGTVVAIKYLSKSVYQAPGFADLFRYEAARLVHIDNPHLALMYEYVEGTDSAAVVMEFIDGVSLRALIDDGGALDPQPALYVLKGVLLGLTDLHGKGIAHGDLRPENVLIDTNGVTKVVDVGIAASLSRKAPALGDQRYRAPEMWAGERPSPTSDVYAATATLFECLTGKPPQTADGVLLGQADLLTADEIAALMPNGMPESVRRLMTIGLASHPDGRAPDAAAMLQELELAARAYGAGWEKAGKTKVDYRMAALRSARRANPTPPPSVDLSSPKRAWTRTLVAVSLIVLVGLVGVAFASGLFSGPNNAAASSKGVVPDFSHTPEATVGPTVPPVPSPGAQKDTTKPQQVVGLHILGRSQTAVTMVWNPSRDNVRVIGYIVERDGRSVGTSYLPGFTDFHLSAGTSYDYTVIAFDAAGNRSLTSAVVFATTLHAPDRAPPSVPTDLHATSHNTTSLVIAWAPSQDNVGVAGYDVFRDDVRIASVDRPGYTDHGVRAATSYRYSVRAYDTSNNASANSRSVVIRTLTKPDKTAPTIPTSVAAKGTSVTTMDVSWSASSDRNGVAGYIVYRNGTKLGTVAGTSYSDYGLKPSTTYAYTIRAYDAADNKSNYSSPGSGRTLDPLPPPPPPPPTPSPSPSVAPSVPVEPTPTVTSVQLTGSPITTPDCTTTLSVAIGATGGSVPVELDYTIAGTSGSMSVTVPDGGTTVQIGDPADGKTSGSASVTIKDTIFSDNYSWTAPDECTPKPPPPTPTQDPSAPPTDPGGGGSPSTDANTP